MGKLKQIQMCAVLADIEHAVRSPLFVLECALDDLLDGASLNFEDIVDAKDSIVMIREVVEVFTAAKEAFVGGKVISEIKILKDRLTKAFESTFQTERGSISKGVNLDLLELFVDSCRRWASRGFGTLPTCVFDTIVGPEGNCCGLSVSFGPFCCEGRVARAISIVGRTPSLEHMKVLVCYCFMSAYGLEPEFLADEEGKLVSVQIGFA